MGENRENKTKQNKICRLTQGLFVLLGNSQPTENVVRFDLCFQRLILTANVRIGCKGVFRKEMRESLVGMRKVVRSGCILEIKAVPFMID